MLAEAKKKRIIKENFATNEFTTALTNKNPNKKIKFQIRKNLILYIIIYIDIKI